MARTTWLRRQERSTPHSERSRRCRPGHARAVLSTVRIYLTEGPSEELFLPACWESLQTEAPLITADLGEAAVIIGGWRGPGWQVFDADPRLGREIRDWIRSAISGHDCPVDAADAALVVSELFGNAARHGPAGGRVLVRVAVAAAG